METLHLRIMHGLEEDPRAGDSRSMGQAYTITRIVRHLDLKVDTAIFSCCAV